ncbi:unnamed protein product, partial [Larinioides sclopetarius]
ICCKDSKNLGRLLRWSIQLKWNENRRIVSCICFHSYSYNHNENRARNSLFLISPIMWIYLCLPTLSTGIFFRFVITILLRGCSS